MIDFHTHIVYGVDDGSETLENSLKILKHAEKAGFHSIILTPHYMKNYYEVPANEIQERINILRKKCEEENIDVSLYQANEIYITNSIADLLNADIASTINCSKYVLFELPMNEEPMNLLEVIYKLIENGKVPIIAHPERYSFVQKDPNKLLELIEQGVLFQANYGSIIGQYGKDVEKTVKILIKNNFISFLGTDVHKTGSIYTKMDEIYVELEKIISEDRIEDLVENNAYLVLDDKEVEVPTPIPVKKSIFGKFI